MDTKKLVQLAADRGITLDEEDALLTVLCLNEEILNDSVQQLIAMQKLAQQPLNERLQKLLEPLAATQLL